LIKIKSPRWIIAILIILFCNAAYAQDSKEMYYKAIEAVKSKDSDSAFMYFQLLLKDYPESKYKEDALFATGEYYFAIGDYRDAKSAFLQLITDYPDSKGRLFALVYLLKMAEKQAKESLVENLENRIVTFKQQIFLFKDYKEYKYKSPFSKKYKVIYSIDKVQFYLDGELFAQISY
jgi:hypothetical protein